MTVLLAKAAAVWLLLSVLAIANGVARNALIKPRLGEQTGHVISTLILCCIIFLVAWALTPWIAPAGTSDAVVIGLLWVVMTVSFEFLAGHYLFGHPWEKLTADYNLALGRIWVLVLVASFLAPIWAERLRG